MLPNATDNKYEKAIADKSVFGSIASVMSKFGGPTDVFAYDSTVTADFVPEYGDNLIVSSAHYIVNFLYFSRDCCAYYIIFVRESADYAR